MGKLISEILNSENVIEKCCELEILKRNWKLLLLDSGVDNLVLYDDNWYSVMLIRSSIPIIP